jgi:hypothetical protein
LRPDRSAAGFGEHIAVVWNWLSPAAIGKGLQRRRVDAPPNVLNAPKPTSSSITSAERSLSSSLTLA